MPAGAGVLYDRTSRSGLSLLSPQTTMSPWLPLHGWKTISFGRDGLVMSIARHPSYVPWKAMSPQKARSELKTPAAGFGLGEKPSGVRLSV